MSKVRLLVCILSTCALGITSPHLQASAQSNQLPQACYELWRYDGTTFMGEWMRDWCRMLRMLPNQSTTPQQSGNPVASDRVDYIGLGRGMQQIYENPPYIWPDGSRGFIGDDGNVYRFTKQIADDGSIVYYSRVNQETRIFRYDASRDATGYTDVWSYSVDTGYLKCRVTMLTDYGRYLDEPQITQVETNNMYPAFKTLLDF